MSGYLDNAATTPLSDAARDAMEPFLSQRFGNASEPHALGRDAREALEDARAGVAALVGAEPHQVIFTSGGTEASNQAVFGLAPATRADGSWHPRSSTRRCASRSWSWSGAASRSSGPGSMPEEWSTSRRSRRRCAR